MLGCVLPELQKEVDELTKALLDPALAGRRLLARFCRDMVRDADWLQSLTFYFQEVLAREVELGPNALARARPELASSADYMTEGRYLFEVFLDLDARRWEAEAPKIERPAEAVQELCGGRGADCRRLREEYERFLAASPLFLGHCQQSALKAKGVSPRLLAPFRAETLRNPAVVLVDDLLRAALGLLALLEEMSPDAYSRWLKWFASVNERLVLWEEGAGQPGIRDRLPREGVSPEDVSWVAGLRDVCLSLLEALEPEADHLAIVYGRLLTVSQAQMRLVTHYGGIEHLIVAGNKLGLEARFRALGWKMSGPFKWDKKSKLYLPEDYFKEAVLKPGHGKPGRVAKWMERLKIGLSPWVAYHSATRLLKNLEEGRLTTKEFLERLEDLVCLLDLARGGLEKRSVVPWQAVRILLTEQQIVKLAALGRTRAGKFLWNQKTFIWAEVIIDLAQAGGGTLAGETGTGPVGLCRGRGRGHLPDGEGRPQGPRHRLRGRLPCETAARPDRGGRGGGGALRPAPQVGVRRARPGAGPNRGGRLLRLARPRPGRHVAQAAPLLRLPGLALPRGGRLG
jgi:hypothetical protein